MKRSTATVLSIVIGMFASACSSDVPLECSDLASTTLAGIEVVSAEQSGEDDQLPGHCRVEGLIESRIGFELLMPDEWNGKFVMGGGGGFVGSVQNFAQDSILEGGTALERGYATVGTDTGHTGGVLEAGWALDNPEAEVDFGHRAVHLTADAAKNLIQEFYEDDIAYSYFLGCSRGGGQGMMESQMYPNDFDGIVVGAPAYDSLGIASSIVQTQQKIYPNSTDLRSPVITADNRRLLQFEILNQCDALDGVEDLVLENPRQCSFDPDSLMQCAGNVAGPNCVTDAQREAMHMVYDGPTSNGQRIYPGFPLGGEADPGGWGLWITGEDPPDGLQLHGFAQPPLRNGDV